jgi:AraC family transcriptional regulator
MDKEYVYSPSGFTRSNLYYVLLGGSVQLSSTFHFEREHYPAYELIYILSGKGTFRCGQEVVELKAGDGLLHHMQHAHGYRADPSDPYQMLYVVFQGRDMERTWEAWFNRPYLFFDSLSPQEPFVKSMLSIIEHMPLLDTEKEADMSVRLYQLLVELYMRGQSDVKDRGLIKPESIERGRMFLEQLYADDATIHRAAHIAGLSYYHFIRQFKRYYYITPKEYVTQIRIRHAKQLLLHSDLPITLIAEQAGFGSYNSFLTMFLSNEQVSPSYYRKMWQRASTSERNR